MGRPKTTEFKTKAQYDYWYISQKKERISFVMDKGTKDRIKLAADKIGQNSSEFIREAIEEKLFKCGIPKQIAVEDPEQKQDN